MPNIRCNTIAKVAAAVVLVGAAVSANAALIEINFATGNFATTGNAASASNVAFAAALADNGLNPATFGGMTGTFFYDDTTAGNAGDPTRNHNGAIDSLSFSIANWFSQSLSGIGNGGDILVTNDGTAGVDVDRIVARVNCVPGVGAAGSACVAQPFNFTYSVTDSNTGVTWVLDDFELFLEENGSNNPLSSLNLPTQAEWESTEWVTRRVDLRFNPNCDGGAAAGCGNITERATLSLLAVPEPGSLALLGIALGAFGLSRRRKKA